MRLQGKVTFVSGAGGGMGRVAALMFAQEGAKIVANDYRADAVEETVQLVRAAGGEAIAVPGDVSAAADVKRAMAAGEEAFGLILVQFHELSLVWNGQFIETNHILFPTIVKDILKR